MAEEIWKAIDERMTTAQAKITYLGEQEKPIPTVLFAVEGHTVSMVRFLSVQRSRKPYVNDELPYSKSFTVDIEEFRCILVAVKPLVTGAKPEKPAFLSFSVVAGAGDAIRGSEFLIPRSDGKHLLETLQQSLRPTNTPAQAILKAEIANLYP